MTRTPTFAPHEKKKYQSELRNLHRLKRKLFLQAVAAPSSLQVLRLVLWDLTMSQNRSCITAGPSQSSNAGEYKSASPLNENSRFEPIQLNERTLLEPKRVIDPLPGVAF
mmetsp:Transcript_15344/g.22650  ORF Transcript_15344/g.22650 Transcript_15344/m.22650 type:complete len:110 (+) Transcript_15344:72-401(+)